MLKQKRLTNHMQVFRTKGQLGKCKVQVSAQTLHLLTKECHLLLGGYYACPPYVQNKVNTVSEQIT